MPWLAIAGTGSPSGRLKDFVDHLLWYRVRLEFPYRAPSSDTLVNFHPCTFSFVTVQDLTKTLLFERSVSEVENFSIRLSASLEE
jgi:hypothetical protein